MIKFNDLSRVTEPYIDELVRMADEVVRSGWYVLGPKVTQFEQEFASMVGVEHCVGVANGTDALEIAMRSVGVTTSDEVITVANAGGYTTTACIAIGATPVYVDVDKNLLIDANRIEDALSPCTKAVVVTHLYGQAVDVEAIRARIPSSVAIVEDCAEAHGAQTNGHKVGSLGDVAAFSFYPTKNVGALGDAGAVVTSRDDVKDNIVLYRQYGWKSKYRSAVTGARNSRLDEIQAAFLLVAMKYLDTFNSERQSIVKRYRKARPDLFNHLLTGERYIGHLAVAQVEDVEAFRRHCEIASIATDVHFPVLDPDQDAMKSYGHRTMDLAHSRQAVAKIVSLPCYPGMTSNEIDSVCTAIASYKG